MRSNIRIFVILFVTILFHDGQAQESNVYIDQKCQRFIGEISELDRTKFFSVHDTGSDTEQSKFRLDYNVTGGRGFWGAYSYAKSKTGEVGVYPDPRPENSTIKAVLSNYVATEHPRSAFKDGLNIFSAADWAVEYYNNFANNSGRQEFFEVMNEPFVHADDFYEGWDPEENQRIKTQMAQFYNEVGKSIHAKPELKNMKVIGYSAAWPSMELWDFGQWEDNMKLFMDVAGENMYGFSTHLYDGINVTGQDSKRSGSNSEAILDIIENYSMLKWNKIKPHAITEYGAIEKGYGDDYSDLASIQTVASINHILLNLLDREDRICNSIPFITGKATWHITAENNYQPYGAVLWKPTNIGVPVDQIEDWEYTPRILFYELWKNVEGKRVLIKSDNPDIQCHAFVKNAKMYVALNNLDEHEQKVNLNFLSNTTLLESVLVKDLIIYPQQAHVYTSNSSSTSPSEINLIKDEFVMLEYTFKENIEFSNSVKTSNYYASNYLEPITTNNEINYTFNNIIKGSGFANLRMSIGRKHDVTKKPIVKVNGVEVEVPTNYKGYDQADREDFFGMIEIPFSVNLLNENNNSVSVIFPDNGGHISSMILATDIYEKEIGSMSVKTISNPCPDTQEGAILFNPIFSDVYTARIYNDTYDETYTFSENLSVENLPNGIYSIALSAAQNENYQESLQVVITSPDALQVSSKTNQTKKTTILTLKGGNIFEISHNHKTFKTSLNTIEIPLKNGTNKISVKTDKDCQGIYKNEISIGNEIFGYPNPANDFYTIDFGQDPSSSSTIYIYNSLGKLVLSKQITIHDNKAQIDTTPLSIGMYHIKIETLQKSNTLTIHKTK
ncbi:T9SS type A sorting domain-containing protein [Flavicella sp.]|uniref:T9SS type A sorting domain-containing protein n=1 Tax=Flavicella sp. TaxID=2957742 RepID=UPI0026047248|nr:T9SS type A sorting domain-containing protein [Flavicella sp.]MDG1805495.1 T9SS type A sorting domain-containing protein [Flavicella sp.]